MKQTGILKQFVTIYAECPNCKNENKKETSVIVGQQVKPYNVVCWACLIEFECVPDYSKETDK